MKLSTLWKMNYGWAYKYFGKKLKSFVSFKWYVFFGAKPLPYTVDGVTILFKPISPYQHAWVRSVIKNYERGPLLLWKRLSVKSQKIADVGGYAGIYGLLASKANPGAKVFIFEPDLLNCRQIRENIKINQLTNIEVIEAVAGNYTGETFFALHAGATGGSIAEKGQPVRSVMLKEYGDFDLVKICAHGAELKVLEGSPYIKNLILKVYPEFQTKEDEKKLWKILEGKDVIPIDKPEYRTIYYVR